MPRGDSVASVSDVNLQNLLYFYQNSVSRNGVENRQVADFAKRTLYCDGADFVNFLPHSRSIWQRSGFKQLACDT
jgi:hypothetical protein